MRAQITLRSGAQIEADVADLTTGRRQISSELSSLEWTTPEGWTRKLHTIEVGEIAAIVLIEEPTVAATSWPIKHEGSVSVPGVAPAHGTPDAERQYDREVAHAENDSKPVNA